MGCYFTMDLNHYSKLGLYSELLSFIQTTLQTIFILNAWWRRVKGRKENHDKPGREIITFLLVANMAIWFINALIKGNAAFRPTHLEFFGRWTWVIENLKVVLLIINFFILKGNNHASFNATSDIL